MVRILKNETCSTSNIGANDTILIAITILINSYFLIFTKFPESFSTISLRLQVFLITFNTSHYK